MRLSLVDRINVLALFVFLLVCVFSDAQTKPADIPPSRLIQPEALAKLLEASGEKPLIIHIGSRVLYTEAHIPGSEYLGPASSDEGQQKLRKRVQSLPKNQSIVLYCGCCPWNHCPNVKPAYAELRVLGFTNVKVLYIAHDFGSDWVEKRYPIAKAESQ